MADMSTRYAVRVILAAAMSAVGACAHMAGSAAAPNTLTRAERDGGWMLLFDGKTTAGWNSKEGTGMPDGWQVVDGALTRVARGGNIMTDAMFADFELRLEWNIERGGNSGIFYRVPEKAAGQDFDLGPEMQVLDDANNREGTANDRRGAAGAAYGMYAPPAGIVKPAGEWNAVRIIVVGNHVEHWLNGVKVVEYELGSPDWEAHVKADHRPARYGRETRGHIGLQDHGARVAFRSIRIKVLP